MNMSQSTISDNISGMGATAIDAAQITKAFLDECDVLYAMRKINHTHLLKSIAAFMRGSERGFIMPRARGSLRTFWETQDHAIYGFEKIMSWLFAQLLGITDGLTKLHGYHHDNKARNRHGALTPDNILWFSGHETDPDVGLLGILVIGDAGRINELRKCASGDRDAMRRYAARESPPSAYDDTWSLGLICFEFVIWLIRGSHGVQQFRSETPHNYQSPRNFRRWSTLLMTDGRCLPDTPLGELVNFIVGRLLVPRDDSGGEGRATASEFHSWVSQVRSAVSAAEPSNTSVRHDLPQLESPSTSESEYSIPGSQVYDEDSRDISALFETGSE